jgi:hypothetical protein
VLIAFKIYLVQIIQKILRKILFYHIKHWCAQIVSKKIDTYKIVVHFCPHILLAVNTVTIF